jgi:DNA-binding CsgD family transcriptional regulator
MDPPIFHRAKRVESLRSVEDLGPAANDDERTPPAGVLPAASSAAEPSLVAASGSNLPVVTSRSARARMAYALLKAAMDNAVQAAELNRGRLTSEWAGLQTHVVESIHDGALSAIELMEALGAAEGPRDVAAAHIDYGRRQRDALTGQVLEYLAAARNIMSILAASPFDRGVVCTTEAGCPAAPCTNQTVTERLRALTERQKRVLELMAEGLPNKLIAYELGLSETTVKAHVSGILRKLCVYSRARAIVLLANIDLAAIRANGSADKSDGS